MWFKNIKAYYLTSPLSLDDDALTAQLNEHAFRPCGNQDMATMGFASPFSQARKTNVMYHSVSNRYWFTLKKQEKILPASVVNAELDEKIAQIEIETGSPVGKKAKSDLKQEIQTRLLPQAFTKNTFIHGFISPSENLVIVDASSDGRAEAFLAMLRKALGSLPVVPLARRSIQSELTHWLTHQPPAGIELLEEAELKSSDELESVIRCKNLPLDSDDVKVHIQSGKLVQKLAIAYNERFTAMLCEDGSVKRIKFTDRIKEETDDIPKDQVEARLDAEFALMSAEVCEFVTFIQSELNLKD